MVYNHCLRGFRVCRKAERRRTELLPTRTQSANGCVDLPHLITVCHAPDSQFVRRNGNKRVIVGVEPELPDRLPVAFQHASAAMVLGWSINLSAPSTLFAAGAGAASKSVHTRIV